MTITATSSEIAYLTDGVTVAFAIPFPFDTSADIKVVLTSSVGTPTELVTGFSISGGGGATGTCTFSVAPAAGQHVTLLDDPDLTQPVDYVDNDAFAAATHEGALDRATRLIKRLHQRVERSIRVADGDDSSGDALLLPIESARAGKFLGFDALGRPTASVGTGGGDSSLRTDLAATAVGADGARLVGYRRNETGSVARSVYVALSAFRNVLDFGAVGNGIADDTVAIQAALDSASGARVFFPNGTYKITSALQLNDENVLDFESRLAIIKGNLTGPLLKGKSATSERRHRIQIFSGQLDNTSRANAGGMGIDMFGVSSTKVFGTIIKNCETGIRCAGQVGPPELGCYYNEFYGVDILTVVTGVSQGTQANDNKFFGGRVNDCTIGTDDNNGSGNGYFGMAIEVFSVGHRNSNTTVSQFTRYVGSRLENTPTTGTGISIGATAQDIFICAPQPIGLSTDISDSGLRTNIVGASEHFKVAGGTRIKKILKVTVNRDIASLAAGAFRQEGPITVTGAAVGDAIHVTLPAAFPNNLMVGACLCSLPDTVYFMLHNPSGGAVDPPALDYVFNIIDYT